VKVCIIIPCFNHQHSVKEVASAARRYFPVFVVDDGSPEPLPALPIDGVIRLERNRGKGAALQAGFAHGAAEGYTHAITVDADGQHKLEDLPRFLAAAQEHPEALIVGVRDLVASGAPPGRRRSNAVSSFWYRIETGVNLRDTQCGFRCYPLSLTQRLRVRSKRFAYELEILVRAAWVGIPIIPVPTICGYLPEQLRLSNFRPIVDLTRITVMNIGLVLQSWLVPRTLRAAWSLGQSRGLGRTVSEVFSEHAHEPGKVASAVGLGLFCGIAPIWGYQMVVAGTLAHLLRLNKAIALLASNISIPPIAPFILYGGLALGHWLLTGRSLEFSAEQMTRGHVLQYLWQFGLGSLLLGALVALIGALTTYGVVRLLRQR
jgi:uncharacterized protein (DUF2062 family)